MKAETVTMSPFEILGVTPEEAMELIDDAMDRRELSGRKLSQLIGYHEHTISRWRNGDMIPRTVSLLAVCLELLRQDERMLGARDPEAAAAIRRMMKLYAQAKGDPLIRKPLAWAMYKTWCEVDRKEQKKEPD